MSSRNFFLLLIGIIIISVFSFGLSVYNFYQGYMLSKHYMSLAKMTKGDINKESDLLKEGFNLQEKYKERSINYTIRAIAVPAIFFCICYAVLYYPIIMKSGKLLQLIKIQKTKAPVVLNKAVRLYLLTLFYIACVFFFLIPILILLYNLIFPPVTGRMITAFFMVVIFIILTLAVIFYILLKQGKKHIALGVMITGLMLLIYGIPVFIVENNHRLFHTDLIGGPIVDYATLSTQADALITFLCEFSNFIGSKTFLYATSFIFIFLGVHLYCWRKKHRMNLVGK